MTLEMIIATWFQPQWRECVATWYDNASLPFTEITIGCKDIMPAFQEGFELSVGDVLGFVHDDCKIHERDWDQRVLREFEDPAVGLVGFAGAPGFCHPNLSANNYSPGAMGRIGFRSNMRNAEVHGARFTGECNAAVIDGFAMFVRRDVLEKCGGWPIESAIGYFCYDYWICCMARRLGYKIRLVGVDCDHLNGRSTGMNPNLKPNWAEAHKALFDEFIKDGIIPAMVTP